MKKLIVKEFQVTPETQKKQMKVGDRYTYFQDPETGKYYEPVDGFEVTGSDLSDRFIEAPCHQLTPSK